MATQYDADGGGFQFTETHDWIDVFGAHYALGVDGLGPDAGAADRRARADRDRRLVVRRRRRRSTNAFFAWMLALEGPRIGVFAATDVFLFYVLFEATLIPIYFLIGGFGGEGRQQAAVKFLIFQLARRPAHARLGDRPVRRRPPTPATRRTC